jgi:hypothetical protein
LVIGAFIASAAAALGGRQRDDEETLYLTRAPLRFQIGRLTRPADLSNTAERPLLLCSAATILLHVRCSIAVQYLHAREALELGLVAEILS